MTIMNDLYNYGVHFIWSGQCSRWIIMGTCNWAIRHFPRRASEVKHMF